ncbi:MAG: M20/M25/M40 family metallo-hydrolase [Pyrinomonadaceae bacterium]
MKLNITRSIVVAAMFLFGAASVYSQAVEERNVRAAMTFLAGDAMQGRGSGTQFERITAEYVGSQFMQFGLEAAGDNGFDGNSGYVQTVNISRATFAGPPILTYGSTVINHGGEMVVLRTNAGSAAGPLQKLIASGQKPNPGSAVLLRTASTDDPRVLQQSMQRLAANGASIVMVEETTQWRATWGNLAGRRIGYTVSSTQTKPAVLVIVSKEIADAISKLSDGIRIEFGGPLAPIQTSQTWNAIGRLTGTDSKLSAEVIVLSSHLDHLGVRENATSDDKLFNGADDDASGTVAVMELARVLAAGKRPKRTVIFVCYGSEEAGGFGSGHFVNSLPFPKERIVANLQWEMIGRPDAKVKPEQLWLTGYERSNLGPELARRGANLVQDPHPSENFFQRSDNFTLARQGVVAHTVSSFGLHTDYHKASDELKTIDFGHMTKSINSMIKPIEWLLNSDFRPTWVEGKRP